MCRYHRDGVESWTKKAHPHSLSCKYVSRSPDIDIHTSTIINITSSQQYQLHEDGSSPTTSDQKHYLSRNEIVDFCKSVQLCQTCCRVEHDTATTSHDHRPVYALRNGSGEYEFLCEHLGKTLNDTGTLHTTLGALSESQGLLTEASIDYYENLRMARIVNHTWDDPFS